MFPSPHARWYDFGIYAYATILQLGKLRSERLNEQTILVITHSLWVWRRRVFCQPSGPATLQATHTVQCVRAQISQMLSLGTARGLAPSHCVYPPVCLPLLCLPEAGSTGLRGVVAGAGPRSSLACTWLPGGTSQQHSKMPEYPGKDSSPSFPTTICGSPIACRRKANLDFRSIC